MNLDEALKSAEEGLRLFADKEEADFNGIKDSTESAFRNLQAAMFPSHVNPEGTSIAENLRLASEGLRSAISRLSDDEKAERFTAMLLSKLPEIRRVLWTDIVAASRLPCFHRDKRVQDCPRALRDECSVSAENNHRICSQADWD